MYRKKNHKKLKKSKFYNHNRWEHRLGLIKLQESPASGTMALQIFELNIVLLRSYNISRN
ncbi:hypothetical protein HMPREF2141_00926 [Bacteroides uniformis]|nr:hypothetical protein HMPREF2141_00926 [Bacteroides uniformis]